MKTKMYISCILALMITAAAWADGPSSPQKQATASLNGNEADQFMSLTEWSEVKFDKLFTYAGFAQEQVRFPHVLDLGAAFKAGPVYIGTWYQGRFGMVEAKNNKSVATELTESKVSPGTVDNIKRTTTASIDKKHDAEHQVSVLVGFGNIGVSLGYIREKAENKSGTYFEGSARSDSVVTDTKTPHLVNKTTYDPKGYVNGAKRTAKVDFGMNLSLGSLSLSPTAGVAVAIKQDSANGVKTAETRDTLLGTYDITKTIAGKNDTKTTLNVKLGADLGLNDSLHSNFSFGYDIGVDIYGKKKHTAADGTAKELANSYTITTDSRNEKETAAKKTVTDTFAATTYNKSNIANKITVGYGMRKDFTDRLSFFAGVEAPIGFDFKKEVTNTVDTSKTVTTYKVNSLDDTIVTTNTKAPAKTVNTTTVTLNPELNAALSYAAIPNRVFLSFGTNVKPFGEKVNNVVGYQYKAVKTTVDGFTKTKETHTRYPNDPGRDTDGSETSAVNDTESSDKTVSYGKTMVEVKLGVRWNIIDAVSFDLVYNKSVLENITWTDIGNLKLACIIKF